jgi:Zn-dependent membrane protease YugP
LQARLFTESEGEKGLVPVDTKLEAETREEIGAKLKAAGWAVQDKQRINLMEKLGVAVREMDTDTGPADYMLFVDGAACGVIEAKREGAELVHLVTLPVELDASFGKALPILKAGHYIQPDDEIAVRRVLRAAAFTYVASSLASLLNLARWLAFLRRA